MFSESIKSNEWELVDPIQSISGSLNGTKPTFIKNGKMLLMISFPHPSSTGSKITFTFKPDFKFMCNQNIGVLNYSGWTSAVQAYHPFYLSAADRTVTTDIGAEFNYHQLYGPVALILK